MTAGFAPRSAVAIAVPVLDRLRQTVAAETDDIVSGRPVAYENYSLRKNQALLELNRLMPTLRSSTDREGLRGPLADLAAKLEENRRALGIELKAALKVAEIVARAIGDGQSDGTYSSVAWKRRPE